MIENSKKATLRDVAKAAGVSVGTVSHFLNNPACVKQKNREMLERVIEQLQYIPNISARSLASGKSKNVILFVLSERSISPTTWLHQLPMVQTVHDFLSARGYSMQMHIVYADDYEDSFAKVRNCVESRAADGIIFISVYEMQSSLLEYLVERRYPFVCLDNEGEVEGVQYICFDNRRLLMDMVDRAYELGHRDIAYIHVRSNQQDMHLRYIGFLEGMRKHKLPVDESNILYGNFSIESGAECVYNALSSGRQFTAILCGNDNMGVGALQAIQRLGLMVPNNISIIGIDNSIAANACTPKLETYEFNLSLVAEMGVKALLRMMEKGGGSGKLVRLKYQAIQGGTLSRIKPQ